MPTRRSSNIEPSVQQVLERFRIETSIETLREVRRAIDDQIAALETELANLPADSGP